MAALAWPTARFANVGPLRVNFESAAVTDQKGIVEVLLVSRACISFSLFRGEGFVKMGSCKLLS